MDDPTFVTQHAELLLLAVLAVAVVELFVTWRLGLYRRLVRLGDDALLGAGLFVGLATAIGGGFIVLWVLANAVTGASGG